MTLSWLAALALASGAPSAPDRPAPPVHVDADEVEYRYKDHKTIFIGRPVVRLTREDAVLVCRRLVTDNDDEGGIQHAVCTGDVKLTRGTRVATCERATYDAPADTVVCVGNPVLRNGASVVRGTEITYDLGEDKVTVTRAKGMVVPAEGQGLPRAKAKAGSR